MAVKNVRVKIFQSIARDFVFNFCCSQVRVTCVINAKKMGVTDFVSEIKPVEKYPDLEKLAHVIQHGLQGFIVKNIESESTEANDLSHIL